MVADIVFIAPASNWCKRILRRRGGVDPKEGSMAQRGDDVGVYAISVVAELVGTGQQNIRLYERKGLLTPDRTAGGTRQYSETDLAVLRRIGELLADGLNLAGVAKVLELETANAGLRRELERRKEAQRRGTR
ncbi:MerR family transcriptional regulator [Pseudarthrobacter sp. L19]|uniref:MerR family transcriptional regulator n=1 Tax=Pseudarthrobacter sp. L19 TaxID=3423951 RepID=UPI003D7B3553